LTRTQTNTNSSREPSRATPFQHQHGYLTHEFAGDNAMPEIGVLLGTLIDSSGSAVEVPALVCCDRSREEWYCCKRYNCQH